MAIRNGNGRTSVALAEGPEELWGSDGRCTSESVSERRRRGFRKEGWALERPRRRAGRTLPLVIDNPRFLILPRIRVPNLGSQILAQLS